MADVKISQLPAATTPVDGTEVLPIVQSATTKQVSIANLTAGRAMAASSLTLTTPLAVTSGGTGLNTTAAGTLLSSTALNTISATATPTLGVAGTTAGSLGLSGSSSGVVTLNTAAAAGTWSMTLPTSGGTNGYILTTNGSGVTSWTNPTALGVDLDVGTTAITGGTSGRVLYNNAGVLGEYTITGTGSVVLGTSPTFTTSITTPLAIGGTGTGSSLTLQSTSGVGATDSILFKVGNNGATTAVTIDTSGTFRVKGAGTAGSTDAFQVSGSAPASSFLLDANGNLNLGSTSTDLVTFYKPTTPAVRIQDPNGILRFASAAGLNYIQSGVAATSNSAAPLVFGTIFAGSEWMRIESNGRVGIGTATPGSLLDVNFTVNPNNDNGGGTNVIRSYTNVAQSQDVGGAIGLGGRYSTTDASRVSFAQVAGRKANSTDGNLTGYLQFCTLNLVGTMAEKARLSADGCFFVNTQIQTGSRFNVRGPATASTQPYVAAVYSDTAGDLDYAPLLISKYDNNTTTSQVFLRFAVNQNSNANGQINANGANTAAFGTWSDMRLKNNIVDLPPQLSNILALRPREFDFIESEGGGHQIGFIAQEMQAVYPDCVGKRDDGMLTITGWSKTEARLVKAMHELAAEIAALKGQLNG